MLECTVCLEVFLNIFFQAMENQLSELNQKLKIAEMDKEALKIQKDELTKEKNEVRGILYTEQ